MVPSSAWDALPLGGATLCVLFGGRSSEREVSLTSGHAILAGLRQGVLGLSPGAHPAKILGVEIAADGGWILGEQSYSPGLALERLRDVDLFFLGLHGTEGEDGVIQGLLSSHDFRYTGSGVCASALAMDKVFSRCVVQEQGLRVALGKHFSGATWKQDREALLDELSAWEPKGWVVKPRREGSSVGVSVLDEPAALGPAIDAALAMGPEVLVEARIQGIEVAAAVLESSPGEPRGLPIVEIVPKPGRFFDYEEKYLASGAIEHCPPQNVDGPTCARLQELAIQAHQALGCRGYSRSDFIVPNSGEPVFLETNTLPGMTPRSLLPLAARAAELPFETLCLQIAAVALGASS